MKGESVMSENYNDENVKKMLEAEKVPEQLEPKNIRKMLDDKKAATSRKKIRKSKILRIVSAAAAIVLIFGTSIYFVRPAIYEKSSFSDKKDFSEDTGQLMKPAAQYSDVYRYFLTASTINKFKNSFSGLFGRNQKNNTGFDNIEYVADDMATGDSDSMPETGASQVTENSQENQKDYSDTYSQESGILEADIVKTDGNNIYYSVSDKIYSAQVDSGKFVNSYKTDISPLIGQDVGGSVEDMYLYNGKLILICSYYNPDNGNYSSYDCWYGQNADTYVAVLDTANQLSLVGYYIQEGSYNDVRLTDDGYLYLISNDEKYIGSNFKEDEVEKYIPQYHVGDEACYIEPDDIMLPSCGIKDIYDYVAYTNISGFDLNSQNPCQPVDAKSIAGYTNTIYCSQQNFYTVSGYDSSEITRFAISGGNITAQASGKVNGYVNDQFSMSEYNGYFRIATTENTWEESYNESTASNSLVSIKNSVYVLDMDMKMVGSISDFGLNERIKSVNFNGDKAYVVTFRQTDPLYAIDLSDPTAPAILDEFKISGYSSYMQNWSDGLLLGFGAEADEQSGWETGVKLTMFDNSNPDDLREVNTVSITVNSTDSDYVYSEALYERKALYIDPERNIIGFPVIKEKYNDIYDEYDNSYVQTFSFEFYSFVNNEFVYLGSVSNSSSDYDYTKEYKRAVYIDGFLYVLSEEKFISVDAVSFKEIGNAVFQ